MAKRYPSKEAREIILIARQLGWEFVGYSGSGHLVLKHENGKKYTIAATPSSHRNRANSLAMLEKLAERKLELNPYRRSRAS